MGGDNSGQDAASAKLQAQIDQQNAELETKRKNLIDQRLAIVKSQGAQNWTPDATAPKAPQSNLNG